MNRIIPPDQFAAEVLVAMQKAEDEAGIPRGSIALAWVEKFNSQFDESYATEGRQG